MLTTGEESGSQNVLLLSWMLLIQLALLPAAELVPGTTQIQHLCNEAEGGFAALFQLLSVVTTFCLWHAELQVIFDVPLLLYRQCVLVAPVASLPFRYGFSWTCGQRAGVPRHCSFRVRRPGT